MSATEIMRALHVREAIAQGRFSDQCATGETPTADAAESFLHARGRYLRRSVLVSRDGRAESDLPF